MIKEELEQADDDTRALIEGVVMALEAMLNQQRQFYALPCGDQWMIFDAGKARVH